MNDVAMLSRAQPREILRAAIDKKTPAILSFLSKGKWHVAKVLLTSLGADNLDIQVSPRKMRPILQKACQLSAPKPSPINIRVHQPVGISLKYGYGKFIFETTVVAIQPPLEPTDGGLTLPTIALKVPDRIEFVQRRSYFRVDVPGSLKVNVMLWHRSYKDETSETQKAGTQTPGPLRMPTECYWQGKLTDISAGGVQIIIDASRKPDFERGQLIGLRFTPMPYETPLMFNAQIRSVLPTADHKSICLGLRIIGLEASPEGRQVLQRLCNVAEHYYQINQCSVKQQDFQMIGSLR
ncbi:MAG: PilZ domain-containing protein [Phycisphaerae bacterium]|nr:PilZ domain-containing protein [Phycisphaerae bacterium]